MEKDKILKGELTINKTSYQRNGRRETTDHDEEKKLRRLKYVWI